MRALRLEGETVQAGGAEVCGPGGRLWVDLGPDPADLEWLRQRFGFHPLAIEDCAHEDQRPKFEDYPEAQFCVIHRLGPAPDDVGLQARELHAFLGADLLVTVHLAPIAELDRIWARCAAEPALLARGPDFAWYLVCDAITDVHFAVADALTDDVDSLADEISEARGDGDLMQRILTARRTHATLRRALAPQREVLAALSRPSSRVSERTALYFRDVLDHLLRVTEEIDISRDLLASAMDIHLSIVNNKLSAITTRLTVVASIFLPLNFVAGFFGMNLEIFPAHTSKAIVLAVTLLVPGAMYFLFRKRRLL
ncbi:MAG: magnesium transporter CorA family protein [Deltaproteobacteria bacterium]|nr:magnesium transporter CorA family protein [Deltaproteobacteria bacterium]